MRFCTTLNILRKCKYCMLIHRMAEKVLTTKMLHIESQGHRPSGFGEDLKGSLPFIHVHIDVAAILVMRPGPYGFLGSIWPCDYV